MTVTRWATHIVHMLDSAVRDHLAQQPAAAITRHFQLTVMASASLAERGDRGWCDGISITQGGIIIYRATASRREGFTLLHELAHHLIELDEDCLSWLADQPDPQHVIEQICDHVAAQLLVPAAAVDSALDGGPPSASALLRLFEATNASRSACAVALARKLPCDGFVLLVEEGSEEVFFGARTRETRPYGWRGDRIPADHPLARDFPPDRALTWWPRPAGNVRREYFMSADTFEGWVVAVFAENNLWGVPGFHLPQVVEEDKGNDAPISCRRCGFNGRSRMWPCRECSVPECPRCRQCDCARRAEQEVMCRGECFTRYRAHLLVDGLCEGCRGD